MSIATCNVILWKLGNQGPSFACRIFQAGGKRVVNNFHRGRCKLRKNIANVWHPLCNLQCFSVVTVASQVAIKIASCNMALGKTMRGHRVLSEYPYTGRQSWERECSELIPRVHGHVCQRMVARWNSGIIEKYLCLEVEWKAMICGINISGNQQLAKEPEVSEDDFIGRNFERNCSIFNQACVKFAINNICVCCAMLCGHPLPLPSPRDARFARWVFLPIPHLGAWSQASHKMATALIAEQGAAEVSLATTHRILIHFIPSMSPRDNWSSWDNNQQLTLTCQSSLKNSLTCHQAFANCLSYSIGNIYIYISFWTWQMHSSFPSRTSAAVRWLYSWRNSWWDLGSSRLPCLPTQSRYLCRLVDCPERADEHHQWLRCLF